MQNSTHRFHNGNRTRRFRGYDDSSFLSIARSNTRIRELSHVCMIDREFCASELSIPAESTPGIPEETSKWDSSKERKTAIKASLQQDALTLPWMPPRPPFTFNLVPFSLSLSLSLSHSLSLSSCPFPALLLLSLPFLSQSKRATTSLRLHELRVENDDVRCKLHPIVQATTCHKKTVEDGSFDKPPK